MTAATQILGYAAPSALASGRLGPSTGGGRTRSGPAVAPRFFSGVVTRPDAAAAALLAVADAVMDRYGEPRRTGLFDPVVTCGGDARLNLLGDALDGEVFDPGTIDVGCNPPMCDAIVRAGAQDAHARARAEVVR